jgi:Tfp pilus assembly protein PilF
VRKALDAYKKAIQSDPDYIMVYKNLSIFFLKVMRDKTTADMYLTRYHVLKKQREQSAISR